MRAKLMRKAMIQKKRSIDMMLLFNSKWRNGMGLCHCVCVGF